MVKKLNANVTIVCVGGWKYSGQISDTLISMLGAPQWIKLMTKTGSVKINTEHIVAIIVSKKIEND